MARSRVKMRTLDKDRATAMPASSLGDGPGHHEHVLDGLLRALLLLVFRAGLGSELLIETVHDVLADGFTGLQVRSLFQRLAGEGVQDDRADDAVLRRGFVARGELAEFLVAEEDVE